MPARYAIRNRISPRQPQRAVIRLLIVAAAAARMLLGGSSLMSLAHADVTNELDRRTQDPDVAAIKRGWDFLTQQAVLTSDFDQSTIDQLYLSWPEPLRSEAESMSIEERRQMTLQRYGLTPRPTHRVEANPISGEVVSRFDQAPSDCVTPLQYVVDASSNWTMNCFACHGGTVYGKPTPGAPNNRYALQTLTDELRTTKFKIGKPLARMELGSLLVPLGTTHGTTNAVVFGMGLMHYRDEELNVVDRMPAQFTHHDMDAPPWWHFHKRPYLYIDGFAQKGHRGLMQFTMIPDNDASFFRKHEKDFEDVYAFISSLRAPKFDGEINHSLARQGELIFNDHCSQCHGTYGTNETYPNRMVALEDIGTDPVRANALTVEGRSKYARSWFAHASEPDEQTTITDPDGYVAPPLDGVWASAPYFHNGSVPTLWHVLHPNERPKIWRPVDQLMDSERIGLSIEILDRIPLMHPDVAFRRTVFDTRRFGKGNEGHWYPDALDESEKRSVLEYLKTL